MQPISLKSKPTDKVIELGGGANPLVRPNVDVRMCHDAQGNPTVDFVANFEEPLPIQSNEWDAVFCQYAMEHISWRKVGTFICEVLRILKPGGKAIFVVPNTEAQLKWIQEHPEGWDGKDFFESASCKLFGDQDYSDNTHKMYLSPQIAKDLFTQMGYASVDVVPYGARLTDMIIQAVKPAEQKVEVAPKIEEIIPQVPLTREHTYGKKYFNGGYYTPFYWDYPQHEITFQHVLARKPESVLDLGCARGYIVKRLQDVGIRSCGLDISKHCHMTRACEGIIQKDVCDTPWPFKDKEFDLCFSQDFLHLIPEEEMHKVVSEILRVSKRSLHGVDLAVRNKDWFGQWGTFAITNDDSIVDKHDLEKGNFPEEVFKGDGKVKLNLGSFMTQFHHGWWNIDIADLKMFAQQYRYNFAQMDLRQGLPNVQTGTVDLIYTSHFLEHLNYTEGLAFLRECRRVLKPDGCMRIIVPDAELLNRSYGRDFCWDTLTNDNDFTVPPKLEDFDQINDECEKAKTSARKLHCLLYDQHQSVYDAETLGVALEDAGFIHTLSAFRMGHPQIQKETCDMLPCLSLYMEAIPRIA